MKYNNDFYRRLIRTCFTRRSDRELTRDVLAKEAEFVIGRAELENLWPVLDELVNEGHIEHDTQKGVYRIKRYLFSLIWMACLTGAMN